jgi:AraC-like DNA-binding protein
VTTTIHVPAPPLDAAVECIWHSDGSGPARVLERVIPTGAVDVVFDLEPRCVRIRRHHDATERSYRGPVVSGPHGQSFVMECPGDRASLGIGFRPGAAAAILGVPLHELTDRHLELEDLWGSAALVFRDRLAAAPSVASVFDVVERELRGRLAARRPAHALVAYALRRFEETRSNLRIDEVVRSTGYSSRRFITVFEAAVGLTPKRYGRVRRLQHAIGTLRPAANVHWARFALEAGFCDQSHLIREFQAIAGVSPGAYIAAVHGGAANHVPVA